MAEVQKSYDDNKQEITSLLLGHVMAGKISANTMKTEMESWRESLKPATEFIDAATSGMPISSDMENMDFQFSSDSEFVPLCGLPTVGFRPSKAA
jgi:uncharacterized protein (DUF305 family)